MSNQIIIAGLSLAVEKDWSDITDELPSGSPATLARPDGIGVLQFSAAAYKAGALPNIDDQGLQRMLEAFGRERGFGEPKNVVALVGSSTAVCGDHLDGAGLVRAWYLTNGRDVALVTYVSLDRGSDLTTRELAEVVKMVSSIQWTES